MKEVKRNYLKEYCNIRLNENDNDDWFDFSFLNTIPQEELDKQYVDLRLKMFGTGFGNHLFYDDEKIITEEIDRTLSIEETKDELKKLLKLSDWQISQRVIPDQGANKIQLIIVYADLDENKNIIIEAMNGCGWTIAKSGKKSMNDKVWIAMSFDPMYQSDVTSEALSFNYLFHITPSYNVPSINNVGLIPRSENRFFQYPDRLHVIKGNLSERQIYTIGIQLCRANNKVENDGNYTLYAIDTNKIPENVRFYYDPRYAGGYYTKMSIPKDCLEIIGKVNFNTDKEITFIK